MKPEIIHWGLISAGDLREIELCNPGDRARRWKEAAIADLLLCRQRHGTQAHHPVPKASLCPGALDPFYFLDLSFSVYKKPTGLFPW